LKRKNISRLDWKRARALTAAARFGPPTAFDHQPILLDGSNSGAPQRGDF